MHAHHTVVGWYPGDVLGPFVAARRIGKGRVVYIAGNVGESLLKYGFEESFSLLENAVYYASHARPCIGLDAPGTVEMIAHVNRRTRTVVVILLNHSSNQYRDGNVIRFCVPVTDLKVTFAAPFTIKDASAIFCDHVEIDRDSDSCTLRLGRLKEYEVLMVRYGQR